MGELDDLAFARKEDGMLADHRTAAEGGEADIAAPTGTGMAVARPHGMLGKRNIPSFRGGAAEEERGSGGCVDLVLMVHLEDLDIEIRIERARRLAHEGSKQVDAEAHIAGFHDPGSAGRGVDEPLVVS